ncbi:hypothetical protein DV737_g2181, partial [Chaetothyriales sp. CBS 132003]
MPAVVFGLNGAKSTTSVPKTTPSKRKAVFDADEPASDDESPAFANLVSSKKSSRPSRTNPLNPLAAGLTSAIASTDDTFDKYDTTRPAKSPKLSHPGSSDNYSSNLSALRNARIQESKVAEVDSSVYDYDGAYDSFSSAAKRTAASKNGAESAAAAGPKYMKNLLASSEQRKRDQLRAREKALQRERELEGDEFADKDKFVTSAYKKQQEELRVQEEEEQRRLKDEELTRAKGEGMLDFRKRLLRRDEERQKAIEEAARQKAERAAAGPGEAEQVGEDSDSRNDDVDENKMAKDMNEKGAHIVINDDGEVVDKRQLLSAGLNVAPKPPASNAAATAQTMASRPVHGDSSRLSHARNAREAQRERQTRMMERQLEEMAGKAEQAAKAEEKELQEKNKSKLTDEAKMDAKARYLARKKEREEAAAAESAKKKNATTA